MNEETLFAEALQRQDPAQRQAFLDMACGGDAALRQRIEALLQCHQGGEDFLQEPAFRLLPSDKAAQVPDLDAVGTATKRAPEDEPHANILRLLEPAQRPGALGRIRHYEVLEVVGQEGFGTVLKVFDDRLHRVVALKVLATEVAANGTARQRFLREARAAAAVRHENVIDIHVVDEEPIPHLVMEYIDGPTLQVKLDRRGQLAVKEILRIGMQIAEGLAAAHKQGLIHRDIKPSNILLENGVERVKISDFGLARAVDDASLTQSGLVAGTPLFMSPEQAEGQPLDQRSDLFSLGSVLYALCTGHAPFRASSSLAVLRRVSQDTPRPIPECNGDIPEWLCAIIARLHAKNPAERFQSARETADLLATHLARIQQQGALDVSTSLGEKDKGQRDKDKGKRGLRALAAVVVGIALASAAYLGIHLYSGQPWRAKPPFNSRGGERDSLPPYNPGPPLAPPSLAELAARPSAAEALKPDAIPSLLLQEIRDPARAPAGLVAILADDRFLLPRGDGGIMRMDRSPDGKFLAVPRGNDLIVFETPSGKYLRTLQGPGGHMRRVTFSPDSKLLAATAWDGDSMNVVRVWDVANGWKVLDREPLPALNLDYLTFSGNSKQLVASGNKGQPLYVADARTGKKVQVIDNGPEFHAILGRAGKYLAAADWNSTRVILWDTGTWQEYKTFERGRALVGDPALSPDGKLLAMGSDSEVKLCRVDSGEVLHTFPTPGHALTFSPDGKTLLTWATVEPRASHTVTRWDVAEGNELGQFSVTGPMDLFFPCLSQNGKDLYLAYPQSRLLRIRVFDAGTGKERPGQGHSGEVAAVAVSPNGKLAASGGADGTVRLWDLASGQMRRVLTGHQDTVWTVAFSPDSKVVASGGADKKVRLWDAERGQEIHVLTGHAGVVRQVAFAPDGMTLASAGLEGAAKLWESRTGKLLRSFPSAGECGCVAFSPNGKTLAAGDNGVIRLLDLDTGWCVATLPGHTASVRSLAFHPDGQALASSANDADPVVRVWDLATLTEKVRLTGHTGEDVTALSRPDGKALLSGGGSDGTVRLWDMTVSPPRDRVLQVRPSGTNRGCIAQSPEGRYLATANADGSIFILALADPAKEKDK